jgi:Cu/Ag efflux protein CusF
MENTMKKPIGIIVLLLAGVLALPLAAQPMADMDANKPIARISHQGAGKVMAVDHEKLNIKLAHDAIKSLGWPPMTMDFSVAKASLLDGLRAGDAVQFELRQAKSKKWDIVKIERM